ncbi:3-isopropylmalate dehydratase small subunit [Waterburya agarophytonicola K14]|uniref:3-isopropylmalate dehydratase small subunit n=1 Tax=Waterburya agarophytonicola KI4 TaxID=2874699 RepID=A0A964FG43_9CYAN|nr:3-isopropylmalate dehydratase small subunit [Waterburya agarophytonicola]MCC0176098.1 3-isopropylmalate dehydratase small subunit [Waterburya agarophytonicola KI4]
MSEVKALSGKAIAVMGDDIDTDRIIPARYLRCVTFDGLGEHAFADDRIQSNGEHPFDNPDRQGASILVTNNNFGCGSSREHAPQALSKWGIKAVIGQSFAEIFFGNCVAIGVPCVIASPEEVKQLQALIDENPQTEITVDLSNMEVTSENFSIPVQMNEGSRQMFLNGTWDNCGQLVNNAESVKVTATKLPYVNWQTA